jgi:hypothetical protein
MQNGSNTDSPPTTPTIRPPAGTRCGVRTHKGGGVAAVSGERGAVAGVVMEECFERLEISY